MTNPKRVFIATMAALLGVLVLCKQHFYSWLGKKEWKFGPVLATIPAFLALFLCGLALVSPTRAYAVVMNTVASHATATPNSVSNLKTAQDDVYIISASASSNVSVSLNYNYIGTYSGSANGKLIHKTASGRPDCFWAYGMWTNSVNVGVVKGYSETSRAEFCMLKKPVTINGIRYTAVKVAGGLTGSPCHNWAIPPGVPQPKPQIIGPVLDVKSLQNLHLSLPVNASSSATVKAGRNCPGGLLTGQASGSGSIHGKVSVLIDASLLVKSHGKTTGAVKAAVNARIKALVEGQAKSSAVAKITIACGPAPPPVTTTTSTTTTTTTTVTTPTTTTTPVNHFTTLSCTGQEEVTGNASSKLVCTVSNDNGADIALNVQVTRNSGNLLVSGIQCSSQFGTPTCKGSGTFEVRLKGVNNNADGSAVYADLEATATSNGVASPTFKQTYQVDSICANFGC